jgi:hypothetical protein
MSWWGIGDGLVIGDGPADAVTVVLLDLAEQRSAGGQAKPPLEELLGAVRDVLGAGEVVAVRSGGGEIASAPPSEDVSSGLREAAAEVRRQYFERWDRPPDPREFLETVLFVVLGAADTLLADGEPDLEAIEARP